MQTEIRINSHSEDWEEIGESIGHFQSSMHTQTTHHLKLMVGFDGKGERHWSLNLNCHTCTHKHNSQAEIGSGLGRKGEKHWSLLVIHAHTKHNSPAEVDYEFGGKGRGIGHFQSYMHTHNSPAKVDNLWENGEALIT